ncbi:MAG: pseudouridine synthase [Candidatus Lokiarchaeota archaeon]|nr:pseudouridine synthase [Candidatus Lokiarchaeota archaeon]
MENQQFLVLRKIKAISDFQFSPITTDILFDNDDKIKVEYSKNTGRIKHIYYDENLLLNFRPQNGLFTLSLFAADRIIRSISIPHLRAVVQSDISEFIKEGRNVFCKHITEIDENLRPLDEIIVVNQEDELLAIGKLILPIPYIKSFTSGVAIKVRKGINKSKI